MRDHVTREQLTGNAATGATWLDEVRPRWWQEPDHVDENAWPPGDGSGVVLELLDQEHCALCVGGQLEGAYRTFTREYSLTEDEAAARGFIVPLPLPPDDSEAPDWYRHIAHEYEILTEAWRAEITRRRQQPREQP